MEKIPQTRKSEWMAFSKLLSDHISHYSIPQYGEKGKDQVTFWSIEDLLTQIKKYINRYGQNSRENQQELDFLKIAHYASLAFWKYTENKNSENKTFTFEGDCDKLKLIVDNLPNKLYKITIETKE